MASVMFPEGTMKCELEDWSESLLSDAAGHQVRWPDETTQLNYTGASGVELMRRTLDFVDIVRKHVPIIESGAWRGLDYGVGWGRIASVMGFFGGTENLDCADAWPKSLELARRCGLRNSLFEVPARLEATDLPAEEYDLIYSYSIFTHLPEAHFVANLKCLYGALKPGGKLIVTVREPKFMDFLKRSGKYRPADDRLDSDGFWFGNAQSTDYGDTIVTSDWIRQNFKGLGSMVSLGVAKTEPFQLLLMFQRPL
jgi:SAM-dependent methyltransferase